MISISQANQERVTRQRRHLRDLIVIAGVTTDRHLLESLLSDIRQMRFVTAGEAG